MHPADDFRVARQPTGMFKLCATDHRQTVGDYSLAIPGRWESGWLSKAQSPWFIWIKLERLPPARQKVAGCQSCSTTCFRP